MNRILFFKFLDRLIGRPLTLILPRLSKSNKSASTKPKRILIIRPGGIGDAVLLLPSIKALRDKFPDSHIDILCEKRNAGVFGLSKDIDRTYLYDKGAELLRCLRNQYDAVVDTEQWHRLSAVIAYLTGAGVRIGFNTNERGKLFTHKLSYSHDDYEAYSFFHLMEPLIGNVSDFPVTGPFIDIPAAARSDLLPPIKPGRTLVAIFPGATVKERRWGGEKFGKVAKSLQDKGYDIVVLGSRADSEDARIIERLAPRSSNLTGKTSLGDVAGILKRSVLLITADSGLMHIALGAGTPTVSLFGSGREKKWAPRGKRHIALNKHLACSPCTTFGYTPRCKRNIECLSSLAADEVTDAIDRILGQTS